MGCKGSRVQISAFRPITYERITRCRWSQVSGSPPGSPRPDLPGRGRHACVPSIAPVLRSPDCPVLFEDQFSALIATDSLLAVIGESYHFETRRHPLQNDF